MNPYMTVDEFVTEYDAAPDQDKPILVRELAREVYEDKQDGYMTPSWIPLLEAAKARVVPEDEDALLMMNEVLLVMYMHESYFLRELSEGEDVQGDLERSVEMLTKAIAIKPGDWSSYWQRAMSLRGLGREAEALSDDARKKQLIQELREKK